MKKQKKRMLVTKNHKKIARQTNKQTRKRIEKKKQTDKKYKMK